METETTKSDSCIIRTLTNKNEQLKRTIEFLRAEKKLIEENRNCLAECLCAQKEINQILKNQKD